MRSIEVNQILLGKIEAVRQRVKTLVWQRAISFSLVTVIAGLIVIGFVDWNLGLEFSWLRFIYSFCLVAVMTWTLWRWILPAMRYRPDDVQVARRIEKTVGGEKDELATSVQVAHQNDRSGQPNSEMEAELIKRANRFFNSQSMSSLVSLRAIAWPMLLLAVAGCICGMFFAAQKETAQRSLRRLSMPWGAEEWPRRNDLAIEQLPDRVAAGGSVSIVALDRNGLLDDVVTAEVDESGRRRQRFELTAEPGVRSIYRGVVNDVKTDFRVRVFGGDDTSDWYTVEVIEIPRVVSLEVQAETPGTIGSNGFGLANRNSAGPVKCWAGSTITVRGKSDSPIQAATLLFVSREYDRTWPLSVEADQISFQSDADMVFPESGEYWIKLEGTDQTVSIDPPRWPVEIIEDSIPRVDAQLFEDFAGLNSLVPVRLQINDRPGIQSASLSVFPNGSDASQKSVDYKLTTQLVGESAEKFERTYFAQTQIDIAQWRDLKIGDLLVVQQRVIDLAGQESDASFPLDIEIVSNDRLIEKLNEQGGRLGRLLGELELRQTALNSRTRTVLSDPINDDSDERLRRRVRQSLVSQRRIVDLFEDGDRSSLQLNRSILEYAARHRLAGSETANLEQVMTVQEMAAGQIVSELRVRIARIEKVLQVTGAPGANARRELDSVVELQEKFASALSNASSMLKVAADFEEMVEKAKRLRDEQVNLVEATAEVNREKSGISQSDGSMRLDTITLRQSRLGSAVERFTNELVALAAADRSRNDPRSGSLNEAIEQIGTANLPNIFLQTGLALDESRPGVANELQRRAARILSLVVSILDPGNPLEGEAAEGAGGLADQINELVDQLGDVDSGLREFSDSERKMDVETRLGLDKQKNELQEQLAGLRNAIGSSQFSDLTKLIDEAIADVAGSPGSVRTEDINNESRKIQSAINKLQLAALVIAAGTTEQRPVGNLSEVHGFLLQLLKAQIGINHWTESQLADDRIADTSREQIVNLQRQVGASFVEATNESLAEYPTAGILVGGIGKLLSQSGDRLEAAIIDSGTVALQARIVNQMRQLIEAIEIQLEASKQKPANDDEQESGESDNPDGGIRSFELTMLYVMQKDVRQQAESLRQQMELAGGETPGIEQQRRELSELQMQIASVLGELLDAQKETIPALPDF